MNSKLALFLTTISVLVAILAWQFPVAPVAQRSLVRSDAAPEATGASVEKASVKREERRPLTISIRRPLVSQIELRTLLKQLQLSSSDEQRLEDLRLMTSALQSPISVEEAREVLKLFDSEAGRLVALDKLARKFPRMQAAHVQLLMELFSDPEIRREAWKVLDRGAPLFSR